MQERGVAKLEAFFQGILGNDTIKTWIIRGRGIHKSRHPGISGKLWGNHSRDAFKTSMMERFYGNI